MESINSKLREIVFINPQATTPLYIQLHDGIKQAILEGKIIPGQKLPGDRDMAEDLNISIKMVRQALGILVDEGLIYRRPKIGTTVSPIISDKSLRQKTYGVGVVFASLHDPQLQDMTAGIDARLRKDGFHMILTNSRDNMDTEIENVNILLDKESVDGIITFPIDLRKGLRYRTLHFDRLRNAKIPFVAIDRPIPGIDTDSVAFDNYGGAKLAVEHLVSLGHKKLVHITADWRNSIVTERIQGFIDTVQKLGISRNNVQISRLESFAMQDSEWDELVIKILDKGATGIFCFTDLLAQLIIRVLHRIGKKVPDDISIIGFGYRKEMDFSSPRLTTIQHPTYEMGYKAAEILISRIGNINAGPEDVILETGLVLGESTAKPKQ